MSKLPKAFSIVHMKTHTALLTEILLYTILFLLMIVTANMSNENLLFPLRSMSFIVVLFYVFCHRAVFGEISARQYVGLKFSSLALFVCLASTYNNSFSKLSYVFLAGCSLVIVCILLEACKYISSRNGFYLKYMARQLIVVLVCSATYLYSVFAPSL